MILARNIAAFTNMFGVKNADVVMPFSVINWETEEDRDNFLTELLVMNNGYKIGDE
jgi:hypothetical protein